MKVNHISREVGSTPRRVARTAGGLVLVVAVLVGVGAFTVSGIRAAEGALPVPAAPAPLPVSELPKLVAAAQREGHLNLIAFPSTWANYGEIIANFEREYSIDVTVASPNATSAQELAALRMMKGQSRFPDMIEIGPSFTAQAEAEGLTIPYKTSNWDQIPAALKDPNGLWVAPYYGLIAFGINTNKVPNPPASWAQLNDSAYRGMFGLNGDPRQATSALNAVWSAASSRGGSYANITPGIDYFGELSRAGIYVPLQANVANLANQQILITADWTFDMPGAQQVLADSGIRFTYAVPTDGVQGGHYASAITNGAPHPNAARLWMEYLLGGSARLLYLKGGAIPATYPAMVAAGQVPQDVQKTLPPAAELASLTFPTQSQQAQASTTILAEWPEAVG